MLVKEPLNRKHEMFLNSTEDSVVNGKKLLNRKHEMFLNYVVQPR